MHTTSDRHDSTSGSFHINISYICGENWNKFHFPHCRYSVQRQQCSKQNVIRSVVKSRPNNLLRCTILWHLGTVRCVPCSLLKSSTKLEADDDQQI